MILKHITVLLAALLVTFLAYSGMVYTSPTPYNTEIQKATNSKAENARRIPAKKQDDELYKIAVNVQIEKLRHPEAEVKSIKLVEMKDLGTFETDPNEALSHVLPTRLVWALQLYYPKGFNTSRGVVKNALVTKIYDSKTGYFYGHIVKPLSK